MRCGRWWTPRGGGRPPSTSSRSPQLWFHSSRSWKIEVLFRPRSHFCLLICYLGCRFSGPLLVFIWITESVFLLGKCYFSSEFTCTCNSDLVLNDIFSIKMGYDESQRRDIDVAKCWNETENSFYCYSSVIMLSSIASIPWKPNETPSVSAPYPHMFLCHRFEGMTLLLKAPLQVVKILHLVHYVHLF